ncbi:MAG: hypothetical protein AB7V62_02190 [Thermoleophilia bacterium]
MERVGDQGRLEALVASGDGFLYNEFDGGWGGAEYSLLHWTGCGTLKRANLSYPKRHFGTLSEARQWLTANRGAEGVAWRTCAMCAAEPR